MQNAAMELAKVLTAISMLDLIRGTPVGQPQLVPLSISGPTTITLPMNHALPTDFVGRTLTLPYSEVFPSIMPGMFQYPPSPLPPVNTFSTFTRPQSVVPRNVHEEALDALAADPDPFVPTCATSANRALWKWRSDCDRTAWTHMAAHCWNRAPSVELCCDDAGAQSSVADSDTGMKVGEDVIKADAPGVCFKYWPNTRAEEFMCCERVVHGKAQEWCRHEDGWGKGAGKNTCECVEAHC